MIDKEAIVADVRAWMTHNYPDDLASACVYWAGTSYLRLRRAGVRAMIQAGSANWRRVPAEEDDGVSPTHFGYEWDAAAAAEQAGRGLKPEMHAWCAISGTSQIIDLSTQYWPEQCRNIIGYEWRSPAPPSYLWIESAHAPSGMIYKPSLTATLFAHELLLKSEHHRSGDLLAQDAQKAWKMADQVQCKQVLAIMEKFPELADSAVRRLQRMRNRNH